MVAGLERITSGTVSFGDRVINDVSPRHRDVAMVFQNYALYPHLSVYQNLGFALENKKIEKAERDRRIRAAAGILGLGDLLGRKPKQLSGGQRQRVAMGRAIVREPSVFLMDEPLSNLDAKLRVQMRSEVLRVHRSIGAATLYVTHDQTEAMTMGDRVAVLQAGVLQQYDTPRRTSRPRRASWRAAPRTAWPGSTRTRRSSPAGASPSPSTRPACTSSTRTRARRLPAD
jgi:multiple sugar transport system ATP-binding protein